MNELYDKFLLGLLTLVTTGIGTFLIKILSAKLQSFITQMSDIHKQQFLEWVEKDIIIKCINTTTQTYVEQLKQENNFSKEAQKMALNKTVKAVTQLLTDANSELLSNYVGDITTWITTSIENYILESKERK